MMLLACLAAAYAQFPEIRLQVTGRDSPRELTVPAGRPLSETLELNEFHKILAKIKLPKNTDFVAFFLKNEDGAEPSTPVIARYEEGEGQFIALVDLGDPLMIQPLPGRYSLQLLVGSTNNTTKSQQTTIAPAKITFSRPLDSIKDEFSLTVKDPIDVPPITERPAPNMPVRS